MTIKFVGVCAICGIAIKTNDSHVNRGSRLFAHSECMNLACEGCVCDSCGAESCGWGCICCNTVSRKECLSKKYGRY
jgi:hypothetical protein